ncbi:MAG: hypothetical protein MI806_11985 [Minwuiales bacterium]|nr:hypothetical protein [Minwuiales bacterium]
MTDIQSWSPTASQNTDPAPDGFPEDIPLRDVDDSAREVMAAVRRQWNDAQWFDYGDGGKAGTYAFVSANQFKVVSSPAADLTGEYHVGRRVKVTAPTPGTIFGTITESSFLSPDTTVTIALDSGSLVNEALTVFLSVQRADDQGTPGTVVVDNGTAAAPSIRFRGDADSGLFLKSVGEIGLSVGGVEQVSFKDDGTLTGPKLGGWELLRSKTASNQAEVVFDEGDIGTTYRHYCFALRGVYPVLADSSLRLQVSTDGGSSYIASAYKFNHIRLASDNTGDVYVPIKSNGTGLYLFTSAVDDNPKRGVTGFVFMDQVDIASSRPTLRTHIDCEDSNAEFNSVIGGGIANTFDVVNAVRFFFGETATNVSGGKIDLYGLRNG